MNWVLECELLFWKEKFSIRLEASRSKLLHGPDSWLLLFSFSLLFFFQFCFLCGAIQIGIRIYIIHS